MFLRIGQHRDLKVWAIISNLQQPGIKKKKRKKNLLYCRKKEVFSTLKADSSAAFLSSYEIKLLLQH